MTHICINHFFITSETIVQQQLFGQQQNQNHYAFVELMLVESQQTKVQAQLCVTILNNQTHEELTREVLGFKQFKITESNSLKIFDKVGENELTLRIDIEVISDKIQNKVNNNLLSNLKMLLTDEKFCDFKFVVQNEEFKAHKNILSIRSNVFAAMFENNMIEKNLNECKIDDIESDVFQELLSFIYTGKSAKIKSMARKLLIASEKYNISELKSICEGIIYNDLNSENAIESLLLADKYNAINLRDKIINFIANNLPTIRETTPDLRLFIDKNPDLVVKIFGAIK
jgi:hypothetical protein